MLMAMNDADCGSGRWRPAVNEKMIDAMVMVMVPQNEKRCVALTHDATNERRDENSPRGSSGHNFLPAISFFQQLPAIFFHAISFPAISFVPRLQLPAIWYLFPTAESKIPACPPGFHLPPPSTFAFAFAFDSTMASAASPYNPTRP